MNKKITMALVALMLTAPITATAAPKNNLKNTSLPAPTIAILDTAIDMSQDKFKNSIVHEVCLIEIFFDSTARCPNGLTQMEGPGAATLPKAKLAVNGFDHGTLMSDQALQTNPNVKIVFIRIIGQRESGAREYTNEATVYNALQWVINNQSKFNIQSVAMAQAQHNGMGAAGTDYCPKTPITENKIKDLINLGVPTFFSAGNGRDYKRIDWPSCIPSSIAIGATMPEKSVAIYSNFDSNLVDFFALGTHKAMNPDGTFKNIAGTSASAVVAATQWATVKNNRPSLSYLEVYDIFSKTSILTSNSKVTGAKLINFEGAFYAK